MRCCGPRRGAHIRGEDRRVDMFWQTDSWSRTPPHLPLCASSPSLCLWTRAFINNLLINGLGNTGGRQIGRGGFGGGREREGIWFLYKLYMFTVRECSDRHRVVEQFGPLVYFSKTTGVSKATNVKATQYYISLICKNCEHMVHDLQTETLMPTFSLLWLDLRPPMGGGNLCGWTDQWSKLSSFWSQLKWLKLDSLWPQHYASYPATQFGTQSITVMPHTGILLCKVIFPPHELWHEG